MVVGNSDVTNPLELMEIIMAFDSRDWFSDKRDRMLWAIVYGIPDDTECEYKRVGYDDAMIAEYRQMHNRWLELKRYFDMREAEVHKNDDMSYTDKIKQIALCVIKEDAR